MRRGLPRIHARPQTSVDFHETLVGTMRALSFPDEREEPAALFMLPAPKRVAMMDRTGLVPLRRPPVPVPVPRPSARSTQEDDTQHPHSRSTSSLLQLPPPVPSRVLAARISPYSILRHSPSIAIQPSSDPPTFRCGGGHHLLRALEFPSNAQVEGEWRHQEIMQERARKKAERAEMQRLGLAPLPVSQSLPALRTRQIA